MTGARIHAICHIGVVDVAYNASASAAMLVGTVGPSLLCWPSLRRWDVPPFAWTESAISISMFDLDAAIRFGRIHHRSTFWAQMLVRPTGNETVAHHELFSTLVAVVDFTCVHAALATLVTEWTRIFVHGRWRFVFSVALFVFTVANFG